MCSVRYPSLSLPHIPHLHLRSVVGCRVHLVANLRGRPNCQDRGDGTTRCRISVFRQHSIPRTRSRNLLPRTTRSFFFDIVHRAACPAFRERSWCFVLLGEMFARGGWCIALALMACMGWWAYDNNRNDNVRNVYLFFL